MDPRILESILYRGSYGKHAVLSPIGYGQIEKHVRRGCGVHSAQTQYAIHAVATEFESELLLIPRVYSCSANFYVMDHVPLVARLRPEDYRANEALFRELCVFYVFMFNRGYYPYGYTIGVAENGKYVLFDFGQFGHVQGRLIKLKHVPTPLSVEIAEKMYGILYLLDLYEIHHVSLQFDPDDVVSTPFPTGPTGPTGPAPVRPTSSYGKRQEIQVSNVEPLIGLPIDSDSEKN